MLSPARKFLASPKSISMENPSPPAEIERTLVTILVADFVSYSRLMAEHEEDTVRALEAYRAVCDGIIELHGGRIFNTGGDSVLAEFRSPVEAVRSALKIQDALRTRNMSLSEERRLELRIGINLGDVIVKGKDLLGDGVNVASRLQSIADPGGICISSSVHDHVRGKLDLRFKQMGSQTLKNIPYKVNVYRVSRNDSGEQASTARFSIQRLTLLIVASAAIIVLGTAMIWMNMRPIPGHLATPSPLANETPNAPTQQPSHRLNGSWVGILTNTPIADAEFCVSLDRRCREFKIDNVTGDGIYEAGWGAMGDYLLPVNVTVSGKSVRIITPTSSVVEVQIDDNGAILKGQMLTPDGHDFQLAMRRVREISSKRTH
jgi:class 3 adenylate cyclase